MTLAGILAVLYAAIELLRETRLCLQVICDHAELIECAGEPPRAPGL